MKNFIKPEGIQKWIKEEFKNLDFNDNIKKNENIAKTLGVISIGLYSALGINENEKFYLRDSQILAILIFIDNHGKSEGIIEEISTGEGKSAIISCLAAYFGLRGYKVDIITSSKTLAERDSNKFKNFYNLLGLTDDNCREYEETPYKADILYGTFLNFEGDLLDEISSNRKIRGDRKYEIIIIDEVDNMFIDGIEGSTQLTHSSKGYQYLIPMYLSIYLFVDILDHLLYDQLLKKYDEIINKNNFKNLSIESKKKNIRKNTRCFRKKEYFC
jgi:preprotein translocase subunit SecA